MMKITKTILARIWWLGRGTATMMGVAIMLAFTVGLASTALAGTGIGARFDLGKTNTVNPEAGTATNLSADKLDGKSADEIGVNGLEHVYTDSAFNSDSFKRVTASCPAGKVVVGTGYEFADDQPGIQEATSFGVIAVTTGTDLVEVSAAEQAPTSANWVVTAIAICATTP